MELVQVRGDEDPRQRPIQPNGHPDVCVCEIREQGGDENAIKGVERERHSRYEDRQQGENLTKQKGTGVMARAARRVDRRVTAVNHMPLPEKPEPVQNRVRTVHKVFIMIIGIYVITIRSRLVGRILLSMMAMSL